MRCFLIKLVKSPFHGVFVDIFRHLVIVVLVADDVVVEGALKNLSSYGF